MAGSAFRQSFAAVFAVLLLNQAVADQLSKLINAKSFRIAACKSYEYDDCSESVSSLQHSKEIETRDEE